MGWFFVSSTGIGVQAGTNNPSQYAGAFYGKVYTSQGYVTSDKNLKKNIQDFNSALSIINKLKPKFYEFKDDAKYTFLHLPNGKHYGLLAQDIEQVLPDLVNESWHKNMVVANSSSDGKPLSMSAMAAQQAMVKDSVKIKAVNYIELIPIMIKALQELNAKNDDLQNQINELKSTSAKESAVGNITSSASYLKQNVPNPAHDKTAIHYYVAGNNTKAEIRITDKEGKVLKIFPVSTGASQLTLNNTELAAGVYHYSLYVNAQLVDAKQMILVK